MAGYITVLIQKSNPEGDWGFTMGAEEQQSNVVINQIDKSCVASELLEAGDRIIEIEGMETSKLSDEEIRAILENPCRKLSMVVLKKNAPKELFNVRKVKTEEVTEIEETKEEIEKLREYEVLLEVSPRESVGDVMKCVKEKLERGEKLDVKELRFIEAYNKMITQSSKRTDSTTESTEKNTKQVYKAPISTELLKRKAKYMKQQQKEETFHIQEIKKETRKETLEEKKKKLNKFWTEPPSDLKKVIEKNQYWQKNENNGGPMTTSAIFSHLNDLHNTLRKTPAREEKRQFWENCRKKYGWDPPETKYDLSHRLRKIDDITRSRSCEPEHLDSKVTKSRGFRETNPFFSPAPTNPFYEECRSMSEEQLSRSQSAVQRGLIPGSPVTVKADKEISDNKSFLEVERSSEDVRQSDSCQRKEISSESNRQDFESKCEFFERATSVPTTSCVKNAQDIVSERLGATSQSALKKPSDFINDIKTEQRKAALSRSSSQEEKIPSENKPPAEVQYRKVSLPEPQKQSEIYTEQKTKQQTFAESHMQKHISSGTEEIDNSQFKKAERNITIERDNTLDKDKENCQRTTEVSQSKVTKGDIHKEIVEEQRHLATLISESMHKNVERIEAEMNESIEKIKAESEKLKSLAFGIGCASTIADQQVSSLQTGGPINIIPDTTAFPGLQSVPKMNTSVSGEFQKRSFVETSYEKVTKTGSPFENVESALRREFRVATPSGFYDNNTEEVFRQESLTEGFREAGMITAGSGEDFIAQSLKEFKLMEGAETSYDYNREIRSETSGELNARSATMIQPGSK